MLVDLYGNPLSSEPDEMQSLLDESKIAGLYQHYSGHPSRGLTPARLASILQQAEQGDLISQCELAEDIEEKDGHIFSELQKRRRALLGLEWQIVPPRNPSEAELADVALLTELMEDRTDLESIIFNLSDAILKGFAAQELEWLTIEGMRIPQCHWRDPAWFQTHPQDRNQLRLRDNSHEGAALQPFGWLMHQHAAKSGYVGRTALARVLAWPYLFKTYSVRDLAEFLEIYGLPLRLGKYPSGANEQEKATLLRAVMSIGHNAGGIIPRGMEIDFQEASKGTSTPFEAMMSWCERTQSKAILGGTLTSQADGKSSTNALGNVHNEVRQELRDSDAKQIAASITRDLIYPMYALNGRSFSAPHRLPRFEFDLSEPEDLAYYAQHLPELVKLSVPVPTKWVTDKLQIPEPEEGEPVLSLQAQPSTLQGLKGLAALKAQPIPSSDAMPGHYSAAALQRLEDEAQPVIDGWVDQLDTLLEDAEQQGLDLADVQQKLAETYPDLDEADLADLLGSAFLSAELAGRNGVKDDL